MRMNIFPRAQNTYTFLLVYLLFLFEKGVNKKRTVCKGPHISKRGQYLEANCHR